MIFCLICHDAPNAPELRKASQAAHLAHIETVMDRLRIAGPVLTESGEPGSGSVLMIEADSAAEARALLEADPFHKAGVWETVEIYPIRPAAGTWIGGKTW